MCISCPLCCCNLIIEAVDDDADFDVPVDIFAIGFEEIVDLNAGNIMSARFAVSLMVILWLYTGSVWLVSWLIFSILQ